MKKTIRSLAVMLAAVLAFGATAPEALGQARSLDRLKFPALPDFQVATPQRVVLDNGLVVLLLEDHELPLVDATVRVRTGSRLETAEQSGLASLTGALMRSGGTTAMDADSLNTYLEGKAASIETFIGSEAGGGGMSCLKEDLPEVLKVFADVLRRPAFAASKLEVEKNQLVAGIARQNDNPQGILFREFNTIIYGEDSPYTFQPTYASVAGVTRDHMVAWHKKYFHPERTIIGLVGDFDSAQALSLIKAAFGDWKKGPGTATAEARYNRQVKGGVYFVAKSDMTQSNIAMGHTGILRSNPDYFAVDVLNNVISRPIQGRLFNEVRTKKGLAYAVSGSVGSDWDHHGVFQMWMTTKTETTAAGIDALLTEARRLTSEPPTEEEVAKARSYMLNSFIFRFDSPREILAQQVTYEYYGYPLDWLTRYRKGIEAVTPAQVRAAAAKYIQPDSMAILVVGPEEGLDRPLSSFGPVAQVDITIPEPAATRVAASPEARKQGRALVEQAVQAMGGAAAVDAVESMEVTGAAVAVTPQGDMELKTTILMDFPDRVRQQLVLPFGTITTVLTASDAFVIGPTGAQDMPESQVASARKGMRRTPIWLLKARKMDGFSAVSAGTSKVDGTAVQLVEVDLQGDVTTLAVDPASGRILQMVYMGQDLSGARGEVTQSFSDFREVEGLTFSFASSQSLNGKTFVSTTSDKIHLNRPVADEDFHRPQAQTAQGGQ